MYCFVIFFYCAIAAFELEKTKEDTSKHSHKMQYSASTLSQRDM